MNDRMTPMDLERITRPAMGPPRASSRARARREARKSGTIPRPVHWLERADEVRPDPRLTFQGEPLRGHLAALMIDAARREIPDFSVDRASAYFSLRIAAEGLRMSVERHVGGASTAHLAVRLYQGADCVAAASVVLRRGAPLRTAPGTGPVGIDSPLRARDVRPRDGLEFARAFYLREASLEASGGYVRGCDGWPLDPGELVSALDAFAVTVAGESPRARELQLELIATLPDPKLDPRQYLGVVFDPPQAERPREVRTGMLWSADGRPLAAFERRG